MNEFFNHGISISKIHLACRVAPGEGSKVHQNRSSHGIAIFMKGEDAYYSFDKKVLHITPNTILYLPKNSNYSISGTTGTCYAINFDIESPRDFEPFSMKVKNKSAFIDFFKQAESAWRKKSTGFEMKAMIKLYEILLNMQKEIEHSYITKENIKKLQPAIEYIHSRYDSQIITISDLANECNISEPYIRKLFQKAYGISPIKYINRLRIERAKELIESGIYSISEVAQMAGYNDESYFSREFKKATGYAPSEYRSQDK